MGIPEVPVTGRKANLPYKIINEDIGSKVTGEPVFMEAAVNHNGKYIGSPEDAERYIELFGVDSFDVTRHDNNVCSIGFNSKEQKWYGWSHRACYGFGVGYVAKAGSLVTQSGYTQEYLDEHPEENRAVPAGFKAKTLEDCKMLAIAFADSVG